MPEIDLFSAPRGTVTAPAGCGKTQLIADSLGALDASKPVLVLTHTNAGKAALEARLARANVPTQNFRISTIDSWAIRTVSKFPVRAGCDPAMSRTALVAVCTFELLRLKVCSTQEFFHSVGI